MQIILNHKNYQEYIDKLSKFDNILILPVYRYSEIHYQINSILFYYVGLLNSSYELEFDYIINVSHYDIEFTIDKLDIDEKKNIFVLDKKSFLKLNVSNTENIFDINLLSYLKEDKFEKIEVEHNHNQYSKYKKIKCDIIPISIHYQSLIPIINKSLIQLEKLNSHLFDTDYEYYNNSIILNLFKIESFGIPFDKEALITAFPDKIENHILNEQQTKIYSEYNIYTSTGRASNKFGGINFSALDKNSNKRKWIVSEYKENGLLIEFDYTAYHLAILAKMVGYEIPNGINMHEYLGRYYFNKETLNEEEYKQTKSKNFNYLYGGIPDTLLSIPYFKKVKQLTIQDFDTYQSNGFINSMLTGRKIQNVEGVTASKLLNYSLQLSEFELTLMLIDNLLEFIQNKKINILLYTYDSLLLDIHKDEMQHIEEIKNILSNKVFSLKTKQSSTNYNELK